MTVWAGVDVGGRRKGFHLAAIDSRRVVWGPARVGDVGGVAALLVELAPVLVAVDSPIGAAPAGERSRPCERSLARSVCGIRYTPDEATLRGAGGGYYEWIVHGLELYGELERSGIPAVECFPTATWTRLTGPRAGRSRARWSREALPLLRLDGIPAQTNQDERDALAAALTARADARGLTERFGEIAIARGAWR
ncbi:MAG: DUF429 domain-containing protein [Thermoleophilia bacterium]|nr:DUF429 domain-containing protein [Thermoleophilia bacterium]